ncbi:GNAT family N-acetyltransferase [Alkalicoccus luteus]|uniref:GNAT family N-acetyltransferase n=1 Tax=Alkalicoccus luteus TaxID=1237094 RepID=A0A969PR71_9BACI|nr:GNAT family N-acetyltransferase [Alkalicoccus luteus]NJP38892.1 GNAT family N-acetyltransferase [Alkalicoccus luteus]
MKYVMSLETITSEMLQGFFADWPQFPDPETHLLLLRQSWKVIIALDEQRNKVAGFITAISDGVLSAYIPLLEVLPSYKNQGIGKELVTRMLHECSGLYMIDLCCDDDLTGYYHSLGFRKTNGMMKRNYDAQTGSC